MEHTRKQILIRNLPKGLIIWRNYDILGITGITLPEKYLDYKAVAVGGNPLDFELVKEDK